MRRTMFFEIRSAKNYWRSEGYDDDRLVYAVESGRL